MTCAEIVTYLAHHGVRVRLAGSELEVDAPEAALTPGLVERVRARKAELVAFLRSAAKQYDWRADCAELFAAARAQCERNLERGGCPDCGSGLLENKVGEETLWYCQACDFTYSAADFAEIRAHLGQHKLQREAA
jgi:hypothetical protein